MKNPMALNRMILFETILILLVAIMTMKVALGQGPAVPNGGIASYDMGHGYAGDGRWYPVSCDNTPDGMPDIQNLNDEEGNRADRNGTLFWGTSDKVLTQVTSDGPFGDLKQSHGSSFAGFAGMAFSANHDDTLCLNWQVSAGHDGRTSVYLIPDGTKAKDQRRGPPVILAGPQTITANGLYNVVLDLDRKTAVVVKKGDIIAVITGMPGLVHHTFLRLANKPWNPTSQPGGGGSGIVVANNKYTLDPNGDLFRNQDGTKIDGNTKSFAVVDGVIYILGRDDNLWRRDESKPGDREFVDGNVLQWEAVNRDVVYVLGKDNRLWRDHPSSQNRDEVDANTVTFAAIDDQDVVVQGKDNLYWKDHGNYHDRIAVTSLALTGAKHVTVNMLKVLGAVVLVKVELDEDATVTLKNAADFASTLAGMAPGIGDGIAAGISVFRFEVWAADTLGGKKGVIIYVTPLSLVHAVLPSLDGNHSRSGFALARFPEADTPSQSGMSGPNRALSLPGPNVWHGGGK